MVGLAVLCAREGACVTQAGHEVRTVSMRKQARRRREGSLAQLGEKVWQFLPYKNAVLDDPA